MLNYLCSLHWNSMTILNREKLEQLLGNSKWNIKLAGKVLDFMLSLLVSAPHHQAFVFTSPPESGITAFEPCWFQYLTSPHVFPVHPKSDITAFKLASASFVAIVHR